MPFAHKLSTPDGREYLRIVEQLVGLFDLWDIDVAGGPTGAQQVMLHIQSRLDALPAPVRHERVTILLALGVGDAGHAGPCARGRPAAGARPRRVRRQPRRHGRGRAVGAGVRVTATPPYVEGHALLDGKGVLVTAAAGTGIGFATAKRCVRKRARGS